MIDWRPLRGLLPSRRTVVEDVDDELHFHIEGRIEDLVRAGRSPEAARREVLERFGDYAEVKRACRHYSHQRIEREGWKMRI